MKNHMKVTYIHHSSFLAETENSYLLFDYFQGKLPKLQEDKRLFVLASHRHSDHFSPVIFKLAEQHPDVTYILSSDIWKKHVPPQLLDRTVFIKAHAEQEIAPGLDVKTLKSTDEGVAFLLHCDGHTIYHAGDLNNWYWAEEPDSWNEKMERIYKEEISRIDRENIQIAFIPLDGRQEEAFYLGVHEFMTYSDAQVIFPMHCWGDFSVIDRLKKMDCSAAYRDRIVDIKADGDSFEV